VSSAARWRSAQPAGGRATSSQRSIPSFRRPDHEAAGAFPVAHTGAHNRDRLPARDSLLEIVNQDMAHRRLEFACRYPPP
jgi:hypothetical protein